MLREGVDVSKLGQELSTPPLNRSYSSSYTPSNPVGPRSRMNASTNTPMRLSQPGTPVIVPPTPTPTTVAATNTTTPSSAATSSASVTSPTSSQPQHDVFYDPNEDNTERQTNRRSIYRSPGTSSSPDLATLLRKAKERGGVIGAQQYKNLKEREKRRDDPTPPLPSHDRPSGSSSAITGRQRSSTNASPGHHLSGSPSLRNGKKNDDWMQSSPRIRETGTLKVGIQTLFSIYRDQCICISSHPKIPCGLFGVRC